MPNNPPSTLDPSPLPGFETAIAQPWLGGVQLNKAVTDLAPTEAARLSNGVHTGGELQTRPGLLQHLATGLSGAVHSIRRLWASDVTSRLFWGAGTNWMRGDDGTPSTGSEVLEGGFSGDPLTFVPIRKPQEEGSWMLVADRLKMRKAGMAATPSLPIGLAAPGTAAVPAISSTHKLAIAAFDSTDGSQAANWHLFAGQDDSGVVAGVPTAADVTGTSGSAVAFTAMPGSGAKGFRSLAVLPLALDLTNFSGPIPVTDDDLVHLQLRLSDPSNINEVRLYFVCSPLTLSASIPGVALTENVAAYMHAFQPSDYAAFIGVQQTGAAAAAVAVGTSIVGGTRLGPGRFHKPRNESDDPTLPAEDPPIASHPVTQGGAGANTWVEFSQIGLPLRRGDFVVIGTAGQAGTDWSTITGIYLVIWTKINRGLTVSLDDCYLTGGAGPDTSEPGAQRYDYRYLNFDTRTGARSNGSPVQSNASFIDSLRQPIAVTPVAAGSAFMRQEFFRRGGSITDNWYFVGANTADGAAFIDTLTDADLLAADTLPTENFQPVSTVDSNGNTVLAQPVPILFGPIADGVYCALGDPHRPGHVYSCLAGNFDAWPSTGGYAIEVCSPSEQLMNGCVWGGGGFVLSRERGYFIYANPSDVGIVHSPTACTPGLACRWGFCSGAGGIFYVARDAVRVTTGGESQILSDQIRPLFNGLTVNGRLPIDFSQPNAIRLVLHNSDLWFTYLDTAGTRQNAVYSLVHRYWRFVDFAVAVGAGVYSDETENLNSATGANRLLLGGATGDLLRHDGYTDLGVAFQVSVRSGAATFGQPRQDKRLGDVVVDSDQQGVVGVLTPYLNAETTIGAPLTIDASTGRKLISLQPFGPEPQRARSLSLDYSFTAPAAARPSIYGLGAAVLLEPEVTLQRVTAWDALPGPEAYLQGLRLDCDTFGNAKTILVEADLAGVVSTIATLTVQTTRTPSVGRHTLWFSWPAVHATLVRLRPTDTNAWMLWRADWLSSPEPARIAVWDSNWESPGGDRYYTGLDLECDTFGQPKTLQVYVDQGLLQTFTVTTAGRRYVHLTLPTGRGHLFRFVTTDANPGLLYWHEWLTTEEPREQANWNAGYTTWSSLSDKNLKGLVIEADTFGQNKVVTIEADGVVVHTLAAVNHAGRTVKTYTFPQILGRVFRVIPTDGFASRPYTILPIFDEEPYSLSRWETQLLDFDLPGAGWGSVLSADVCYRSTVAATLTIACYNALGVLITTISAALPSTGGVKQKVFVPFVANKGVLFKFTFQTADDSSTLALYQEESRLRVQQWAGRTVFLRTFGNADTDTTRNMVNSVAAAARPGGGS